MTLLTSNFRTLGISITIAGFVGLAGCTQATDNNTEATESQNQTASTIRIATEGAYPPFNYTESDGSLAGYDIDVVNALCEQMQAKCEIVAQDWDGIIPGLMAGKYDAIAAGMSVTEDRLKQVDFSEPYFKNTMVWVAKNDGGFDANAIENKTLGSQRSTSMGQYLREHYDGKNGNTVNLYDTQENSYLDLSSGRVEAVLAEKVQGMDWLSDNPDFGIIGTEIDNNDNIAIAVRKDDPLKEKFNAAMAEIRANGKLAEIEAANFGK